MIALRLPHLPDIHQATDQRCPRAVAWGFVVGVAFTVAFWGGLAWLIFG